MVLSAEEKKAFAAYINNKQYLAVNTNGIDVIDTNSEKILKTLPIEKGLQISVLIVSDGKLIIGRTTGTVESYSVTGWEKDDAIKTAQLKKSQSWNVSRNPITALSYNGNRLIAGDSAGMLSSLSLYSSTVEVLGGHTKASINNLAMSNAGLISYSTSGEEPRVWTTAGRVAGFLPSGKNLVQTIVVSKDGKKTAIATTKGVLIFEGSKLVKEISLPSTVPPIINGTFSPDNDSKYILFGTKGGYHIINSKTNEVEAHREDMKPSIASWRGDKRQFALFDGTSTHFFNNVPGRPVGTLKVSSDIDGVILIDGDDIDNGGKVYKGREADFKVDVGEGMRISLKNDYTSIIYRKDKTGTLTNISSLTVKEGDTLHLVVSVPVKEEPKEPQRKTGYIEADISNAAAAGTIAISKDGTLLTAAFDTNAVIMNKGNVLGIISQPEKISALEISADKKTLFIGNARGTLSAINIASKETKWHLELQKEIIAVALSGNGDIVTASGNSINIINSATGAKGIPVDAGFEISAIALYGDRLAIGGESGDATIINIRTRKAESRIFGLRTQAVTAICWIDKNIAISYIDGLSLIVNSATGIRTLDAIRGGGPVHGLSSDGKTLAILYDASISLIDLYTGKEKSSIKTNSNVTTALFWHGREEKLVLAGAKGLEFYNSTDKQASFHLYATNTEWIFISSPTGWYNPQNYYTASSKESESRLLKIRLRDGSGIRALDEQDRKDYNNLAKLQDQF
jgi:hypothetical protein